MSDETEHMKPAPQVTDILGVFAELFRGSGKMLAILLCGLWLSLFILRLADGLAFGDDRPDFAVLSFTLLAMPFFAGAVIHHVIWDWAPGLAESFDVAARAYLHLLGVAIASRLIIGFGFALLILPGLAAIMLLSLAPVIIIAEGPGVLRAIAQSARRIAGAFVTVMLAYGVFLVGMMAALFAFSIPLAIVSGGQSDLFSSGISAFLSIGHFIFACAIYLALKGKSGPQPAPAAQ